GIGRRGPGLEVGRYSIVVIAGPLSAIRPNRSRETAWKRSGRFGGRLPCGSGIIAVRVRVPGGTGPESTCTIRPGSSHTAPLGRTTGGRAADRLAKRAI